MMHHLFLYIVFLQRLILIDAFIPSDYNIHHKKLTTSQDNHYRHHHHNHRNYHHHSNVGSTISFNNVQCKLNSISEESQKISSPSLTTLSNSSSSSSNSSSGGSSSKRTTYSNDTFGGKISQIDLNNENDGFVTAMSVPTFATTEQEKQQQQQRHKLNNNIKRLGLEGIIPGAFALHNVFTKKQCDEMIQTCNTLGFHQFNAGKNNHGALQIVVSPNAAQNVSAKICPFIDLHVMNDIAKSMALIQQQSNINNDNVNANVDDSSNDNSNNNSANGGSGSGSDVEYTPIGINHRWRIYKYEPGSEETFAPHIDAGFPPSSISKDGEHLIWDARTKNKSNEEEEENEDDNKNDYTIYDDDTISRLTVLMYLNDDFQGGHTKFYAPVADRNSYSNNDETNNNSQQHEVIASFKPKTCSILLFPQAVGEEAVEYARKYWPLHEGSSVTGGERAKYVIRSDVLFTKAREGITEEEKNDPLWRNDDFVRNAFMPKSSVFDSFFLKHCQELYNPHMGVENAGPLLYSLVRFTKLKKIVEIGAGYTTLWLLQALKDNDDEVRRIKALQDEDKCRLLDIPWTIHEFIDEYDKSSDDLDSQMSASLLCVDNCLHQKETATGAAAVTRKLGMSDYLSFIKGDAFDMKFDEESIDLLWCDFGVGSRMKEFATGAWKSIKPGGFLVCHSTLTNSRTRDWLEKMRNRCSEEETGVPEDEFVELSLLEPQKRYQNSITILQRRKGSKGRFEEQIYSEYA